MSRRRAATSIGTQPIPVETLAECAASWALELAARRAAPTVDLKPRKVQP